jgi:hypothetical protein
VGTGRHEIVNPKKRKKEVIRMADQQKKCGCGCGLAVPLKQAEKETTGGNKEAKDPKATK